MQMTLLGFAVSQSSAQECIAGSPSCGSTTSRQAPLKKGAAGASFGEEPSCTGGVCKASSGHVNSNVLLQSKVQTSVEASTDDDGDEIQLASPQHPGPANGTDKGRALILIKAVTACLADRIKDAYDANDTRKTGMLDAVLEGEVYKLMRERNIPLTALPDKLPWGHDEVTAGAGILAGTEAAEEIAQDDFESAIHSIFPNAGNSTNITHAHGNLSALAEKIGVFLNMCGDTKEVNNMTAKALSLQARQTFTEADATFLMATAGYISNKCQLDALDLNYFVSNAGPGNVPKRNNECSLLLKTSMITVLAKNHKHALTRADVPQMAYNY